MAGNMIKITDYDKVTPTKDDVLLINQNGSNRKTTVNDLVGDISTLGGKKLIEKVNENTTSLNENENDITDIKSDKSFIFCNLLATTIATDGICKINNMSIQKWFEVNSEGQLKCLVGGAYKFHASIDIDKAPIGRYEVSCRKNTTASDYGIVNNSSVGRVTTQVTSIIRMSQDDLIDVFLNQTSGTSVTVVSDSRFSKVYIERIGN